MNEIIQGGGLRRAGRQSVKFKAWLSFFIAIIFCDAAWSFYDAFSVYAFVPGFLAAFVSLAFFIWEMPLEAETPGELTASDPWKLYSRTETKIEDLE